jgi:hypothetical protein
MRFDARHVGSGLWGIWDAGVMGWRATDLAEDDAQQQAADLNVTFNQYGQRDQADRLQVDPPVEVESARWAPAGKLDWWDKRATGVVWPCAGSRRASEVGQGRRSSSSQRGHHFLTSDALG